MEIPTFEALRVDALGTLTELEALLGVSLLSFPLSTTATGAATVQQPELQPLECQPDHEAHCKGLGTYW